MERFNREIGQIKAKNNFMDSLKFIHTNKIKEKIIKPWIEQLPYVSYNGIYYKVGVLEVEFEGKSKILPVENELLFEDFKKHVKFNPNPFNLLEELKKQTEDFWKFKDNLYKKIIAMIKDELRVPISPKNKIGKWEEDTFSYSLTDWIYNAIILKAENKNIDFKRYYNDFNSKVIDINEALEYFVDRNGFIKVKKDNKNIESFKDNTDRRILKILSHVKKFEYNEDATAIIKIVKTLNELKNQMKINLEKHLELIEVFPGNYEDLL